MAMMNPAEAKDFADEARSMTARIFHDATVAQTGNDLVISRRVEMNQNIEYSFDREITGILSRIIRKADAVQVLCDESDGIGRLRITFLLPGNPGESGITQVASRSKTKTLREYREEVEHQQRNVYEALAENERESYEPSRDFDPMDEESVRLEAQKALDWIAAKAGKRMVVDFGKLKQSRELEKLVNGTNFGVFEEKTVTRAEPNDDHASMLAVLRSEFEDRGYFLWNLIGTEKDRFSEMLRLSDGVDITVGFYDDELSIEFLFGVDDVYMEEVPEDF